MDLCKHDGTCFPLLLIRKAVKLNEYTVHEYVKINHISTEKAGLS